LGKVILREEKNIAYGRKEGLDCAGNRLAVSREQHVTEKREMRF